MPIYEFKCDKCDILTETNIPGWKEGQAPDCHKCNEKMKKMVSLPGGIHFKGSGFYKTDYKDRSSDVL